MNRPMRWAVSYLVRAVSRARMFKQPSSPTLAILSSPRLASAVQGQSRVEPALNWCTLPKLWCGASVYNSIMWHNATTTTQHLVIPRRWQLASTSYRGQLSPASFTGSVATLIQLQYINSVVYSATDPTSRTASERWLSVSDSCVLMTQWKQFTTDDLAISAVFIFATKAVDK